MKQNALQFFWWLKHLMYVWVRSKVFPKDVKAGLGLDPSKPVVYLFQTRSLTNLLVVDHYCEKAGLPRPLSDYRTLKNTQAGAWLYLTKPGLLAQKRSKNLPPELYELVQQAGREGFDPQLVPVSVFWGRNPGKEEKSLFKLLFFDEENGGLWQRFVTFFVQGRNVFCNFGKPISLQAILAEGLNAEEATKKLRRVLRVHFRRQRETVLGPYIYDRAQVINTLLSSKDVREAMDYEAKKRAVPVEKMELKARKYADEVCAKVSYHAIRFFDILLSRLWKKIYSGLEVKHSEKIRELAEQYELVYMPSHRSHMDYLLIGYVLYYLGLLPPHTIAGINLNFWPAGPLLRRGGGIFIRRTFGGDRLYAAIVSEFVQYLLKAGFPFCFYPEGGRSRTGFLLPPKLGILSMVVQGCLQKEPKKPILLVPIYVGYDQIMEGHTYQKELGGRAKKSESFRQLLKATKILGRSFGRAYLAFGEPLDLKSFLSQQFPSTEQPPKVLPAMVSQVAQELMERTNAAAVLTPVSLFSLIILATPQKALSEEELLAFAAKLWELLQACPQGSRVSFPEAPVWRDELVAVEQLGQLSRYPHPGGDVIYATEQQGAMLGYYRNNVLHTAALPALIAGFLRHNDEMLEPQLLQRCLAMYAFFKQELYLALSPAEANTAIAQCLLAMQNSGLLLREDQPVGSSGAVLHRPEVVTKEFSYFRILGRMLGSLAEKYAIYAFLLARYLPQGVVLKEALAKECQLMSQRLAILNGLADQAWFDELSFGHFIKLCVEARSLQQQAQEEQYRVLPEAAGLADMFLDLLSYDVRQSLKRAALSSSPLIEKLS